MKHIGNHTVSGEQMEQARKDYLSAIEPWVKQKAELLAIRNRLDNRNVARPSPDIHTLIAEVDKRIDAISEQFRHRLSRISRPTE
jgi:hypothetical protein